MKERPRDQALMLKISNTSLTLKKNINKQWMTENKMYIIVHPRDTIVQTSRLCYCTTSQKKASTSRYITVQTLKIQRVNNPSTLDVNDCTRIHSHGSALGEL